MLRRTFVLFFPLLRTPRRSPLRFQRAVGSVALLLLSFVFSAPSAPCAQRSEKAERIHGIVAGSGTGYAPYYLGIQKGFYLEEGIELLITYVRGSLLFPAILSGGADYILSIAAEAILTGAKTGTPIKIMMGLTNSPEWGLYVHPAIKSIQDLKGKLIQTGSIGGTQHRLAQLALQRLGLNSERDVTFLAGGASSQRLLALKSGLAHGAILASPANYTAEAMGFRKLLDLGDILPLPANAIVAPEQKIKGNPDQVKRLIRATLKSSQYVLGHKDETVDWIVKSQRVDRDTAIREYDSFIRRLSRDGLYTEQQLRLILQVYGESGDIRPNQIADFRLLKEVLREQTPEGK